MDQPHSTDWPCNMALGRSAQDVDDNSDTALYPLLGAYGCYYVFDIRGLHYEFDSLDLLYYGGHIPCNEHLGLLYAFGPLALG